MLFFFNWQDCKSAKCKYIKCILKDIEVKSDYFVKVKTRIWSGTFISVNTSNNLIYNTVCYVCFYYHWFSDVADEWIQCSRLYQFVMIGHLSDRRTDLQCWCRDRRPWSAHYRPQTAASKITFQYFDLVPHVKTSMKVETHDTQHLICNLENL